MVAAMKQIEVLHAERPGFSRMPNPAWFLLWNTLQHRWIADMSAAILHAADVCCGSTRTGCAPRLPLGFCNSRTQFSYNAWLR